MTLSPAVIWKPVAGNINLLVEQHNYNHIYSPPMSFFYSYSNYLTPYLTPIYSLYAHPDLQTPTTPLLFPNCLAPAPDAPNTPNPPDPFKPLLLPSAPTCDSIEQSEKRLASRGVRQGRREVWKGRDQNFGWRKQKKDRNVISNILKGFVHYATQGRGMVKTIELIAKKRGIENGVSQFYQFMAQGFRGRRSYVGLRFMQERLTGPSAAPAMKALLAITLQDYLRTVYPLSVVCGQKLKRKAKLALLKKARKLASELFAH